MSSLTLEIARRLIAAAREHASVRHLSPLTVVVLDAGGHLVAAEREDGASIGRFDVARGKAHGALALGMGTRSIMARAEDQAYFVLAAAAAIGGSLIPVPGGVLVKDPDGVVLGAIGVSGDTSDADEEACVTAIGRVGLVAQPD